MKLCLDMLDEYVLRSSTIPVGRAKFEVKGAYNPDLKRKREKKRIKKERINQ